MLKRSLYFIYITMFFGGFYSYLSVLPTQSQQRVSKLLANSNKKLDSWLEKKHHLWGQLEQGLLSIIRMNIFT